MKTTILTFYLFIITLVSCNSNDNDDEFKPTLPPITQTGENTFGCYIDGELLIPRDGTGTYTGPDRGMKLFTLSDNDENNIYKEIKARDFKGDSHGILIIHFSNIDNYSVDEFIINESNCEDGLNANNNTNITLRWYGKWYCSINNGGSLNITKLDNSGNYSGTFNCTVKNRDNSNDIIEITQGRFDIHSPTLPNTNFP